MTKPSDELEKEIMEYIFSKQCGDHNHALRVWKENPWKAVSLYEIAAHPAMLELPLAVPGHIHTDQVEEAQLRRDVDKFMNNPIPVIEDERAPAGEYDMGDGTVALINRFGRITNPGDFWDEEEM